MIEDGHKVNDLAWRFTPKFINHSYGAIGEMGFAAQGQRCFCKSFELAVNNQSCIDREGFEDASGVIVQLDVVSHP